MNNDVLRFQKSLSPKPGAEGMKESLSLIEQVLIHGV